jgi:NADH:ubiquinone oxidoreductase subunit 5 (subunit L)/multisubunit Na+/H+ antiporter MnhA subunit
MEAPVPASALIHSATLVSAGIYLLLRYNILLQYSNISWYLILIFSSFTSFYGAIIAAFQTDGKKILAYSTISHCGFLMISILLFNPLITLLYLLGHGLFKSASFMCIGNLIQVNNNYQDSRMWGGQLNYFFFEFYTLIFCIINLSGFPFTINFFTKHFLLFSYNYSSILTLVSYIFLKFAAYSGIFYSFKIILNSFYSIKKNFFKNYLNNN